MDWPSRQDYESTLQNFNTSLLATQFRGGSPIKAKLGFFEGISGGYSVVYPIKIGSKKLALRCWIQDPGSARQHYALTQSYLEENPCEYFVDFGYVEQGIKVNDSVWPISYMDWIEGATLSKFLDDNISKSRQVLNLAEQFKQMVSHLHELKISHGDLQDGNIMVVGNNNPQLKLVDYDSLFTPKSNPLVTSKLPGVSSFQHPTIEDRLGIGADYFSELVIYLSLRAYGEDANLWQKDQEKMLLFTADDFIAFRNNKADSEIYKNLQRLSADVKHLTDKLVDSCKANNIDDLLPLEQILPSTDTSYRDISEFFSPPRPKGTQKGNPDNQTLKPSDPLSGIYTSSQDISEFFPPPSPEVTQKGNPDNQTTKPTGSLPEGELSKYFQNKPTSKTATSARPQSTTTPVKPAIKTPETIWSRTRRWFVQTPPWAASPTGLWSTLWIICIFGFGMGWLSMIGVEIFHPLYLTVAPSAYLVTRRHIASFLTQAILFGMSLFEGPYLYELWFVPIISAGFLWLVFLMWNRQQPQRVPSIRTVFIAILLSIAKFHRNMEF